MDCSKKNVVIGFVSADVGHGAGFGAVDTDANDIETANSDLHRAHGRQFELVLLISKSKDENENEQYLITSNEYKPELLPQLE